MITDQRLAFARAGTADMARVPPNCRKYMRSLSLVAVLLFTSPALAAPVKSNASLNINLGKTPRIGVNLAGCQFVADGTLCPTPTQVNTYIDKGFTAFRIPFQGYQANNPLVIARIKAAAAAAAARGAYVILDRHDFAGTFDVASANWWAAVMKNFPDSTHVMIDTMNEPKKGASYEKDATGKSYATEVNAGIAAFRKAGFKHILMIEWRGWSNMGYFDKRETATKTCGSPACSFDRAGGLKDPLGRTMVSGHRYPDFDSSGTHSECITGVAGRSIISNAVVGAQARGLKVWLGEFAFGNSRGVSAACRAIGTDVLKYIKSMPTTVAGVSWWGGGNGWKETYIYKVETTKGTVARAANTPYLDMLLGK
jgi:endoglucanase